MKKYFFTLSILVFMLFLMSCSKTDYPRESQSSGEELSSALLGEFSVSATKKVRFSKGNLYWDGSAFHFENCQYDHYGYWENNHVRHFFWSKTASVAYAEKYKDPDRRENDVLFTNSTPETAKSDFTVDNITGKYRTLSNEEWKYLFETRTNADNLYKSEVTVCGLSNCVVIAPDNWDINTNPLQTSYSAPDWVKAEAIGLVCLPATGYRSTTQYDGNYNPRIVGVGDYGYYWSSSAIDTNFAYLVRFVHYHHIYANEYENRFDVGCSIRLVLDIK